MKAQKTSSILAILLIGSALVITGCAEKETNTYPVSETQNIAATTSVVKPENINWITYNENIDTLKGIQYPKDFYVQKLSGGSGISIQSSQLPMVLTGEKECAFDSCAYEGLQITIASSEKNSAQEKNMETTNYQNIKEYNPTKLLANPGQKNAPLKEYFYFGKDKVYKIQVFAQNYNGDMQKIIDGILTSLHE